jgi:asparagine synthase (glutamine-hydrolysing)
MGGTFFCIINKKSNFTLSNDFLSCLLLSKKDIYEYQNYLFLFGKHSLLINDTSYNAHQPFVYPIDHFKLQYKELLSIPQKKLLFSGEIYNYKSLKAEFEDYHLVSESDGEVILPLYNRYGIDKTLQLLDGEFSFILTDNINTYKLDTINIFVVRDHLGIKPMYIIYNALKEIYMFVSELKSVPSYILSDINYIIDEIPPGSYWSYQNSIIQKNKNQFINYYNLNGFKESQSITLKTATPDTLDYIYSNISELITTSIIDRIPVGDNKFGILLSGGFDSSLISSIIVNNITDTSRLVFFTISDNKDNSCSTDLINFLQDKFNCILEHHIIDINIEDILSDLPNTIKTIINSLEMYDEDTIRDAIPFVYLFDYIKKYTPEINILISGDGLDEIANGYAEINELNDQDLIITNINIIQNISNLDLVRTEKISCNYSIEMRYPYLNTKFIEFYLSMSPILRRPGVFNVNQEGIQESVSKFIVRKSFSSDLLPYNIMWRPLNWSAQSITNLEETLDDYFKKIYNCTQKDYYKKIYNNIYKRDITRILWKDNFII